MLLSSVDSSYNSIKRNVNMLLSSVDSSYNSIKRNVNMWLSSVGSSYSSIKMKVSMLLTCCLQQIAATTPVKGMSICCYLQQIPATTPLKECKYVAIFSRQQVAYRCYYLCTSRMNSMSIKCDLLWLNREQVTNDIELISDLVQNNSVRVGYYGQ